MSVSSEIFLDWLYTVWAKLYWPVALSKFIFWIISIFIQNSSLVDTAYVFNHFLVGTILFGRATDDHFSVKSLILWLCLFAWFLRLGGFLFTARILAKKQDPRYEKLAARHTRKNLYFFYTYQMQGLVVMFTSSNLYFVFRRPEYLNGATFTIGLIFIIGGIIGEAISDQQLENYKKKGIRGQTFQSGLWKYSRHPNLFFELCVWFGFGVTGINDQPIELLGLLAPLLLWAIMNYLTIPITEASMKESRPNFQEFIDRTNKFIPLPLGISKREKLVTKENPEVYS